MKTVAEIIDMVEEYAAAEPHSDWHGMLADIERAIKEREATRHFEPISSQSLEHACITLGYAPQNNFGEAFRVGARWAECFLKERS